MSAGDKGAGHVCGAGDQHLTWYRNSGHFPKSEILIHSGGGYEKQKVGRFIVRLRS